MLGLKSFLAALIFYTRLPLPPIQDLLFERIARWGPIIGLFIGLILGIFDQLMIFFSIPIGLRSAIVVALWIYITGGLHLDGAIDTADGLAVADPQRQLTVMQDSVTGAYGVMAAMVILLLKWAALSELDESRLFAVSLAAAWGRWGQVVAIAVYPYLKATGKGAFHQKYLKCPQDILLGLIFILLFTLYLLHEPLGGLTVVLGSGISLLTGYYFYRQLKGQTGDTYGAIVEWTETLFLCGFVIMVSYFR